MAEGGEMILFFAGVICGHIMTICAYLLVEFQEEHKEEK
jgi:hypothetical protein